MKFESSPRRGRLSDKIITVAHAIGFMMCLVWAQEYAEQGKTNLEIIMWVSLVLNAIGFARHALTDGIILAHYYWTNRHAIMAKHREKSQQNNDQ